MGVVASSTSTFATAYSNQRHVVRFANGVLLAVTIPSASGGLVARTSADNGATWQVPAVGQAVTATVATSCHVELDPQENVLVFFSAPADAFGVANARVVRGIPDPNRTGFTWSANFNLLAAAYSDGVGVVAPYGSEWRLLVLATNSGTTATLNSRIASIAANGTMALIGTLVAVASSSVLKALRPAVAKDANNRVHLAYATATGIAYRNAPFNGGDWAWGSAENVEASITVQDDCLAIGLDGQGRAVVAYKRSDNGRLLVKRRAGDNTWVELPGIPAITPTSVGVVCDGDAVYVALTDAYGVGYIKHNGSWSGGVSVKSDATAKYVSACESVTGSVMRLIATTGSASPYTVESFAVSLNQAPFAPGITLSASVFAAATGTDITITHNDSDQMSAWALKRTNGTSSEWWLDTAKAWHWAEVFNDGTGWSVIIPAAANAGDWTEGNTYQLYAATRDSNGVTGLSNATAVMANVGATPHVTLTSPTTTNNPQYTAQITVDMPISATRWRVLDGATPVSDTGKTAASLTRTVETPTTGKIYTVEVTAWDTTSGGGIASAPATKSVTASFITPARPTIAAFPIPSDGRAPHIWLSLVNPDNLLTPNQANGGEDGTTSGHGSWSPNGSLTLTRDAAFPWQGASSIKLVNNHTAPQEIHLRTDPVLVPVVPGRQYSASAYVTNGTANNAQIAMAFFDAQGVNFQNVFGDIGGPSAGFVRLGVTGIAPPGAVSCFVDVAVQAGVGAGIWWDGVQFQVGPLTPWRAPGPTVISNTILRRLRWTSDRWTTLPGTVAPNGSYDDYSAAAGVTYAYAVTATGDNGTTITGYTDGVTTNTVTLDFAGKIPGSTVENPNVARFRNVSTFDPPNTSSSEFTGTGAVGYDDLQAADGVCATAGTSVNGATGQHMFTFAVLTDVIKKNGAPFWWTATELKSAVKDLTVTWKGFGIGANAAVATNGAQGKIWNNDGNMWALAASGGAATVQTLAYSASAYFIENGIDATGFLYWLANSTYPSDGTRLSQINTDHVQLVLEVHVQTEATLAFTGVWLHDVRDPAGTAVHLTRITARTQTWTPQVTMAQYAGRSRPVPIFGEQADDRLHYDATMFPDEGTYAALRALAGRMATLCVRDSTGRKMFGIIPALTVGETPGVQTVPLDVVETDYREGI